MSFSFTQFADALRGGAEISAKDVLAARQWAWNDGGVSVAEAESIIQLNRLAKTGSREWTEFFVEALTEFLVNTQPPRGYIDDANAAWLKCHIDQDGKVETGPELELLVKVLETALNAPQSLKDYALQQIEFAVTTGTGPSRVGTARPGVIDDREVSLLRRLLFASGSESGMTVSRDEAEALWRIKDACRNGANAPGWKTLFVQAVGNHLMAHNLFSPLERTDAVRLEAFINDNHTHIGKFLSRVIHSLGQGPAGLIAAKPAPSAFAQTADLIPSMTPMETKWVQGHIGADGGVDPLEQALLAFIAAETGAKL
jgi:hypothetical protein